MQFQRHYLAACFCLLCVFCLTGPVSGEISWQELEKGLFLAEFGYPDQDTDDKQKLVVLQIDPEFFQFKLLAASESGRELQTLGEWAKQYRLQAVINAGMFWKDRETSTGFMKNFEHINNNKVHPDYGAFLLFNPKIEGLPEVQVLDLYERKDWEKYTGNYYTAIQNFRLISAARKNAWRHSTDNQKHSAAAIGQDKQGRIYFLLSPRQYTLKQFSDILLQLPIHLKQTLFVEGGATAGLHVNTEKLKQEWHGDSDNTLWANKAGQFFKIPNVIGIKRK